MTEKEIQELVRNFNDRKDFIVPVIGEDFLFYVDDAHLNDRFAPEGSVPLQQYLVDNYLPDVTEQTKNIRDRMIEADWYYFLTLLDKTIKNFGTIYTNVLKDAHVKLSKEIVLFLEQNNFPFILTTLTTDVIERTVGDRQYKAMWYHTNWAPNTLYPIEQPTVFHLMGDSKSFSFVKNENDLVLFLDNLLSTEHGPNGIFSQLTDKALMVLGCELPDWVFRLLLYHMDKIGFDGKKQGFWFTGPEIMVGTPGQEKPLSREMTLSQLDFLDQIRFQHLSDLKKILPLLLPGSDTDDFNQRHGFKYDIFLSYAGGDVDFKNAVARKLQDQYPQLKIWAAPERTQQGGDYWENIQKGIQQSRYFMPLISFEYLAKMLSPDEEYGKWLKEETKEAVAELNRRNEKLSAEGQSPIGIYSLPVINAKGQYFDTNLHRPCPINNEVVEKFAEGDQPKLPPVLFLRKHMYEFLENSGQCTFLNNDWSRYKGEIE